MKPIDRKAEAWDLIGELYWNAGYRGGPGPNDVQAYLRDVQQGDRVAIIGASTRSLVDAALKRGALLTVLDFSQQMCGLLAQKADPERCTVMLHDIRTPVDARLWKKHRLVLADRLLNRFVSDEVGTVLTEMLHLLSDDGEIRTSIRIGLYARDLPLIQEGRRSGTLSEFFDEESWHIDYSNCGELLDRTIQPHGFIPRGILLDFYVLRGREKRFKPGEVEHYARNVSDSSRALRVARVGRLPDTPEDTLFCFVPDHDAR